MNPYAHGYIADAVLGCSLVYPKDGARPYVDWRAVERLLKENGLLK